MGKICRGNNDVWARVSWESRVVATCFWTCCVTVVSLRRILEQLATFFPHVTGIHHLNSSRSQRYTTQDNGVLGPVGPHGGISISIREGIIYLKHVCKSPLPWAFSLSAVSVPWVWASHSVSSAGWWGIQPDPFVSIRRGDLSLENNVQRSRTAHTLGVCKIKHGGCVKAARSTPKAAV